MQEQRILGISLYTFQADLGLTDKVFDTVKSLTFCNTAENWISEEAELHKREDFREIHDWFEVCLKQVNEQVGYPFPQLKIILSWANRSEPGIGHHFHMHNNSLVSGVFYLTEGSGGETYFSENNDIWKRNLFFPFGFDRTTENIPAKRGRLVVFPSNLRHGVRPNLSDEPRYSIAFNAFPRGKWGGVVEKNKIEVN